MGIGTAERGGPLCAQLLGMGRGPHIESMGFPSGVYMDLGSPTSKASFWVMVLQRFISG